MNEVTFPGFNLKFQINSIAIKIGKFSIYWYAIFIVLAIVIALFMLKREEKKYEIKFQTIFNLSLIVLPIAILTARIYYLLFNLTYYQKNPSKIFFISDGGLAIYGGILGAIVVIFFYCKRKKISLLSVLDLLAPYMALGQAIGRWGNFFNIEAYGKETQNIFRMGIWENGIYKEVHPTFLYESIGDFLLFLFLFYQRKKRKKEGEIVSFYFIFYGILRTIVESLRTDSLKIGNYRISQIVSMVMICIFGTILLQKKKEIHFGRIKNKNF